MPGKTQEQPTERNKSRTDEATEERRDDRRPDKQSQPGSKHIKKTTRAGGTLLTAWLNTSYPRFVVG